MDTKENQPIVPYDRGIEEPSEDAILWRYINFQKYFDLFNKKILLFVSPKKFKDRLEGAYTGKNVEQILIRILNGDVKTGETQFHNLFFLREDAFPFITSSLFITCWHVADHETMSMWENYAGLTEGIAIQTKYKQFKNVLDDRFFVGLVKYCDENEVRPDNSTFRYFYKAKPYENEKEVRAIYINNENIVTQKQFNSGFWALNIEPNGLIEKVIVSPDANEKFLEDVSLLASSYKIEVEQSKLGLKAQPKKLTMLLDNICKCLSKYADQNCIHCGGNGFIKEYDHSSAKFKFCLSCCIANKWEFIKQELEKYHI